MIRQTRREGAAALDEMREFAGFSEGTQRYIRRSLDVGSGLAAAAMRRARGPAEAASIRDQGRTYGRLEVLRGTIPQDNDLAAVERFMAPLVAMTAFDLAQKRLPCFSAYRFLYERLLGAAVRPWLVSAFCAAATLPCIHPQDRPSLLASVSPAVASAPGWSSREPRFFPEWVENVDLPVAA